MTDLGPGGIPYTREEALEVSRGARARADQALEVYRPRAGDELLRSNDDGGLVDQLAEHYGISRTEIQQEQDPLEQVESLAVFELLLDVMHYATSLELPWMQILNRAARSYEHQQGALRRILVYEGDDKERPE